MSHNLIRRCLATLAAAQLLALSLGPPLAATRDLGASLSSALPLADQRRATLAPANELVNPDDDFSDDVSSVDVILLPPERPSLGVRQAARVAYPGEPQVSQPRLLAGREDFERGPPTPA